MKKILGFLVGMGFCAIASAQSNPVPDPNVLAQRVCQCAQQAQLVEAQQRNAAQRNETSGIQLKSALHATLQCMGGNTMSKELAGLDRNARQAFEQQYLSALQRQCPQVYAIMYSKR